MAQICVRKVCIPNLTHQHITPTSYRTSKHLYYPTSKRLYHLNQIYIIIYKHLFVARDVYVCYVGINLQKMQLNVCRSQPNFQIRICGFGFESPDLDLDLDLRNLEKVGFGFGLDLSFFKRADLDLDLKIGPDLDLDSDLNIAGFAHH